MSLDTVLSLIERGGMLALLLVIIGGGARQAWVFGWVYRQMLLERDEWKTIALKGLETLDKAAARRKP